MGDDRVLPVDRVHEIVDDPILVDRFFRRRQFGRPFVEPILADGLNFLRDIVAGPFFVADLGDQRFEHELGVAEHRGLGREFLVDVGGVVRAVNDRLAVGNLRRPVIARQARSHGDDAIRLLEKVKHHLRRGDDRGAKRQRMVFRERPLAGVGGQNRQRSVPGEPSILAWRARRRR